MASWTETCTSQFRMRRVFENEQLTLIKIEGALTPQNAKDWEEEFILMIQHIDHAIIFDCASLTTTKHELRDILQNLMTDNMYFLNLSTPARNMLHSAGLGERVLD